LGIASHCGSGMVSLCFLGKTRDYEWEKVESI
jgi:hypothetical protein